VILNIVDLTRIPTPPDPLIALFDIVSPYQTNPGIVIVSQPCFA